MDRRQLEADVRAAFAIGPGAVLSLVERLLAPLEARIAALEAARRTDSHNSSKPPSTDAARDPARRPKSLRGKSGKRPGGQPGHEGTTLEWRAVPDAVAPHAPAACAQCGATVPPAALAAAVVERRQVHDLVPARLAVTEHQCLAVRCPHCGAETRGAFPPEARTTLQYGPGVYALGVYLTTQQHLPPARAAETFGVIVAGPAPSPATLLAAEHRAAAAAAPVTERIRAGLARSGVLHVDETGCFVATRPHWLHVASTPALTLYGVQHGRGRQAHAAMGLLPDYRGVLVHDGLETYFAAGYPCTHALCNAHLLRDLTYLAEECHATWAAAVKRFLRTVKRAVDRAKALGLGALAPRARARYRRRYAALLAQGDAAEPPPRHARVLGRLKRSAGARLLYRLRRDRDAVLRFATDFRVPFDNSEAERDLRMMKLEQKISGGFRTPAGADTFALLRGYIVTARKQGQHALTVLRSLFTPHPWLPALPE